MTTIDPVQMVLPGLDDARERWEAAYQHQIADDAPVVRIGRDVDEWSPSVELPEPTPATGDEEKRQQHESSSRPRWYVK